MNDRAKCKVAVHDYNYILTFLDFKIPFLLLKNLRFSGRGGIVTRLEVAKCLYSVGTWRR